MLQKEITPENIKLFVVTFYTKTIQDEKIGHYFSEILGDDITNKAWLEHIDILTDFWSSMLLGEKSYRGSPFAPHIAMNLKREDFKQWLILLEETLDEIYENKTSQPFIQIGHVISTNFMRNLNL